MIDKKYFKLRETTSYRGCIIKVRKGSEFWMAEICDQNNNSIHQTRFCVDHTEARNEAAKIINTLVAKEKLKEDKYANNKK